MTLPPDMKFKFSFQINKWHEHFAWLQLPHEQSRQQEPIQDCSQFNKDRPNAYSNQEIAYNQALEPLNAKKEQKQLGILKKQQKVDESELILHASQESFTAVKPQILNSQYNLDMRRSQKLSLDPILETKYIIGYSPDKCLNLKWSRIPGENIILFTSGGTIIAMDVETNQQKRFFFGHSTAVCCFDVTQNGALLASAQEGKNSIVRIWEYQTGKCLSMLTMPSSLKQVTFSPDNRFLTTVGKDSHNKELIIVWDISKILKGEKPEVFAKQTSDFNILCIKFSPIDSSRLVSCGKENIRFWRVKDGSIRGSAVVLNHNARNTVFTSLDFEWGARAVANYGDINPISRENESLKRIFVASKHGMVFQVNYLTEALEATYRTNETAIYTIAVNEAFCVTGSEDQFLRVWPLDFSEFFMEAKHEGTVCQVEISPDALNVVCGTLHGSLGILDKSNQRYRTLMRAHTSHIVSIDFHVPKRSIITVSNDNTIRLWDIQNFDQIVEFSSPIDQPLCVAAHPFLPIFSCGFNSGTMRVFDIEKTCLADEFTQFNKPLRKIAYSPTGNLLVTCSDDGSVALHNASRQHLPTKMMHLEFPPKFVHVAFSPATKSEFIKCSKDDLETETEEFDRNEENRNYKNFDTSQSKEFQSVLNSFFGIMGDHGQNLMVYDTETIMLKNQIHSGHIIKSFEFSKNASEAILVTVDLKIKFISLSTFDGVQLRELQTAHKGAINTTDLSLNGGYMITGGDDNLIKVWDYEAHKTMPYYFQAFIGHSSPVKEVMFNPFDNNTVITTADQDGLYIWKFNGDTQQNYHAESDTVQTPLIPMQNQTLSVLEKMRMSVKENKKPKLTEYSFAVPNFQQVDKVEINTQITNHSQLSMWYHEQISERELTYNHFISMQEISNFDLQIEKKLTEDVKTLESNIVNGYEGFGGVHSNLLWNVNQSTIIYTLNNKVIKEHTKTRKQVILCESTVRLSCLAQSQDCKLIAAAEGEPNSSGNSYIYLFDMDNNRLINKLTFHQKGVQSIIFAENGKTLVSLSVADENTIVLWDIQQGLVFASTLIHGHATNQIVADPSITDRIEFCTVGTKGHFTLWKYEPETDEIQSYEVDLPDHLYDTDFVTACYTEVQPDGRSFVIIGASDGSVVACNPQPENLEWIEQGRKSYIVQGQIGTIIARNKQIVIASSTGMIVKYPVNGVHILPPLESDLIQRLQAESSVSALVMDELNMEGMIGTSLGNIHYLSFNDQILIKLVSRACATVEPISKIKFDQTQKVFLSTSGNSNGDVKLFTSETLDQVMSFTGSSQVSFICGSACNRQMILIGHVCGLLKLVSLDSLKIEAAYQIKLQEGEFLTTASNSPTGKNFAIGTSLGYVYFGNCKADGKYIIRVARLTGLSLTQNSAVTSIQLSMFDPNGCLLVAFDNGQVRTWRSDYFTDTEKMLKKVRNSASDIAELGQVQFNLIDNFDMFENPHGLEEITAVDKEQLTQLYSGKICKECEAVFAPGNYWLDHYFAYVSALQYLFVRHYETKQTLKRIPLMHFPTCLQLTDYRGQALIGVGTKEGRVLLYNYNGSNQSNLIGKTQSGLVYGGVTSLAISEVTQTVLVASESGEIMSFDLKSVTE